MDMNVSNGGVDGDPSNFGTVTVPVTFLNVLYKLWYCTIVFDAKPQDGRLRYC